jgi:hypothetical protein
MPEGMLESYSRLTQVCQLLVNAETIQVDFDFSDYATGLSTLAVLFFLKYSDERGAKIRERSWSILFRVP